MTTGERQAPQDFARLEALFHACLDLPPAAREAFLQSQNDSPELLQELRELLAADSAEGGRALEMPAAALEELAQEGLLSGNLPRPLGPYRLLSVVGQGGMGMVFEAERADGTYAGRVAIKMLRPGPRTRGLVERFWAERRTLARLEHPGIARLLDAGADADGSPWLALEFVRGERIDRYCDQRRLPLEARLRLFVQVAAAVAHAHEQLVVHRDLKPDNILVTDQGRVRLLDFGIAKVLEEGQESLELTQTGERALTPAYASPEQLAGAAVLPRSDVYSLGLVLFELLCGRRPYRGDTSNLLSLSKVIVEQRRLSPSEALFQETPGQPTASELAARRGQKPQALKRALVGDLERICALALHPEAQRRYANAGELQADLERYLNGQPVRASGDSWGYRTRRWIQRHRSQSLLLLLLLSALLAFAVEWVRHGLSTERQWREIQQLGDAEELANLLRWSDELWPAVPAQVEPLRAWIERAEALLARRPLHAASLARLQTAAGQNGGANAVAVQGPESSAETGGKADHGSAPVGSAAVAQGQNSGGQDVRSRTAENPIAETSASKGNVAGTGAARGPAGSSGPGGLDPALSAHDRSGSLVTEALLGGSNPRTNRANSALLDRDRDFAAWRSARLNELLSGLDQLGSPDPFGATLAGLQARLSRAEQIRARSLEAPKAAWEAARARLAADPRFAGVTLPDLLGLLPLGPDPTADLEAFLVLDTGTAPARDASGNFLVSDDSGIVLLLLPGGPASIGAQADDPSAARFDPGAEPDEAPLHSVLLEPFLLSKYELTQGQWERLFGDNPSERKTGPSYPVDRVHWQRARQLLARHQLQLPSEAQWEYAARAGSDSVFHSGADSASLQGFANLADLSAEASGGSPGWTITRDVTDGYTVHAPVGSYAPNAFGLCDMHGNLWEWVADQYLPYDLPPRPGDGLRLPPETAASDPAAPEAATPEATGIVARGGSYMNAAPLLRSAERYRTSPTNESRTTGIRPSRPLR